MPDSRRTDLAEPAPQHLGRAGTTPCRYVPVGRSGRPLPDAEPGPESIPAPGETPDRDGDDTDDDGWDPDLPQLPQTDRAYACAVVAGG